jgi:hypothetical protein
MSDSTILALGMQGLVNAAKSEATIAQMLQAETSRNKTQMQTDRVTISQAAISLFNSDKQG